MLRLTSLALLAFSSQALAHFALPEGLEGILERRGTPQECCPCPGPGPAGGPKTITVTEPAGPTHTVTITQPAAPIQTVTVTEHGNTVTVTQGGDDVITRVITVNPVPSSPTGPKPPHQTVDPAGEPEVVTVTVGGGGKKTVTLSAPDTRVITKTITDGNGGDHTVVVKPEPITKTITLTNGVVTTTVVDGTKSVTVTAPPHVETIIRQGPEVHTVTRTVTADGKTEVEIVVIDETGVVSCKKHNGDPCHHKPGVETQSPQAIPIECGPVPVSTSIKTVYNTVVVTLSSAMSHNATMVTIPTATTHTEGFASTSTQRAGRMVRAPLFRYWW